MWTCFSIGGSGKISDRICMGSNNLGSSFGSCVGTWGDPPIKLSRFLEGRSSMGKETCHKAIPFASTLPKDNGFFALIRSVRTLIFFVFGISTAKVRLGASPRRKQLRTVEEEDEAQVLVEG
jgi:hypothetical protein